MFQRAVFPLEACLLDVTGDYHTWFFAVCRLGSFSYSQDSHFVNTALANVLARGVCPNYIGSGENKHNTESCSGRTISMLSMYTLQIPWWRDEGTEVKYSTRASAFSDQPAMNLTTNRSLLRLSYLVTSGSGLSNCSYSQLMGSASSQWKWGY